MRETLFAWLGDQDLEAVKKGDWPGPIGQAVRERRFDQLVLLSDRPRGVTDRYVKWLQGRTNAAVEVVRESLNRRDLSELFDASKRAVENYLETTPEAVLTFHLTPGTAMTGALWIILAKLHFDAQLITSSIELGVETVEAPKALTGSQLPQLVKKRQEKIEKVVAEGSGEPLLDHWDATDEAMKTSLMLARRAAPFDVPVLIRGEPGTGRARFARAIHNASSRAGERFERVDPRGLSPDELLLELFGQTEIEGVQPRIRGKLELSSDGSLLLERLELWPMRVQVEFLRSLEDRTFRRLDAKKDRDLESRLIATVEGDPNRLVQEGRLHEGLLLRLSVAIIKLPPIRARKQDLRRLVENIWQSAQKSFGGTDKKLSPEAVENLVLYEWPGNVRELRTVLMRSLLWSDSDEVSGEDIRRALELGSDHPMTDAQTPLDEAFDIQEHLDAIARTYVERAIRQTEGNKTRAAELLGLGSYQTLTNWMKRLSVD
jgi:DNA-binding NtrC family response regulator